MTDNDNNVRINKFLADNGVCSRRKADERIMDGRILVNGKVAELGDRIDPTKDKVTFDGKDVLVSDAELEYWVLNKPVGVVSTADDEQGRTKVTDLVKSKARIYPVGRLDENSEGLLLLTNDGELTNKLTHPSFEHIKSYRIIAKQNKSNSLSWIKRQFEAGIYIDGKKMQAKEVTSIVKSPENGYLEIELDLITGYNRQIRRMCDRIGLDVRKLSRTGFANLKLSDLNLEPGQAKRVQRSDII